MRKGSRQEGRGESREIREEGRGWRVGELKGEEILEERRGEEEKGRTGRGGGGDKK